MSNIKDLTIMLKSSDPDQRYDACEKLRVSASIPPETLEVLRSVAKDENSDVADAAHRAIMMHTPASHEQDKVNKNIISDDNEKELGFSLGIVSTSVGIFLSIGLFVLLNLPDYVSGSGENPLRDPKVQQIGSLALTGIFFIGLFSIIGIVIGRKGIKNKTSSPWLGITEWSWSWLGILINVLVLIASPICWLLLVIVLGTA